MGSRRTSATIASVALKSLDELPGPATLPFIGSPTFVKYGKAVGQYHSELVDNYKKYGAIYKETLPAGAGTVVHVFRPEDVRTVFHSNVKNPRVTPLQENIAMYREMRGRNAGLGNMNGEEWYRMRVALQQVMMKPASVQEYLPSVNEVAADFTTHIKENLNDEREVDMRLLGSRWYLESGGLITFERRLGAFANMANWADRIARDNHEVFQLTARMRFAFPFWRVFPTKDWRRMVAIEDFICGEIDRLVEEAIDSLRNVDKPMRYLRQLVDKRTLNEESIKMALISLFSDGLNSTVPTIIYNLYLLANNPDCQLLLQEELHTVNPRKEPWTHEMLTRLPYLRACIKECFRMFPLNTEIARILNEDVVLSGYAIPAETIVEMHHGLVLREPEFFPDGDVYKPARWLRREDRDPTRAFQLTPFSHGARMCIGRRFVDQDLLVVLATLLSRFTVEHRRGPIDQVYETLLMPAGDLRFRMIPLDSSSLPPSKPTPKPLPEPKAKCPFGFS